MCTWTSSGVLPASMVGCQEMTRDGFEDDFRFKVVIFVTVNSYLILIT